jgi:hypothetical protein
MNSSPPYEEAVYKHNFANDARQQFDQKTEIAPGILDLSSGQIRRKCSTTQEYPTNT